MVKLIVDCSQMLGLQVVDMIVELGLLLIVRTLEHTYSDVDNLIEYYNL